MLGMASEDDAHVNRVGVGDHASLTYRRSREIRHSRDGGRASMLQDLLIGSLSLSPQLTILALDWQLFSFELEYT